MKYFRSKRFLFLTILTLTTILVLACTRNKKEDPAFENFVREVIKANVKGLDPVISSELYGGIAMGQVHGQLMQYHYLDRPTKAVPFQADGMPKISKDGMTYTFKIRKDVFFHDDPCFKDNGGKGRQLEAEDFIYSWKRLADPYWHSDGFWIFEDKVKGFTQWRDAAVKAGKADYSIPVPGLKALDKHTLEIKLERPYPQLLYVLTMIPSSVVPREAIEMYGKEFQNHPVGTGAYKFRSWTRGSQLVYDRNPNYMNETYPTTGEASDQAAGLLADAGKKLPLNDGVIFTEIVEDQPRWLGFRKGEYDYVEIPKDNFDNSVVNDEPSEELKKLGIGLSKTVAPDVVFVSFNMEDPVVGGYGGKGKLLRQAISLSIDRVEFIKKFHHGQGMISHGPIPPTLSGYDPNRKNPYSEYNIAKAKELLKKAGYPDGKGLPELEYDFYTGASVRQISEFFQQSLAQIGIKLKLTSNTWPEFIQKHKKKKSQIFGMAWAADYPDAENFLQLFYGPNQSPGPNNSNFNHPEFNKLYKQTSVMLDSPARNKIYNKMVDIVVEEAPWIFKDHRKDYFLTHAWFKNYKRNLMLLNYTKYYRVDKNLKAEFKKKL